MMRPCAPPGAVSVRGCKEAGERAFKDYNPAVPRHRADAFRFLTQNLGQAFDLALETKDTKYPVIHAFCTPFCKLGSDNADFVYQQAWIDGESVYKISGNRGTARFLNFTVQGPRPEKQPGTEWPSLQEPFGDIPEANLFGHQLETQWDGGFELIVGGPRRGPNWLPTTPGSRKLFLRQGFDRWSELPAQLRIERVGMTEPRPVLMPDDLTAAMDWAGRFVTGVMNDWPDHPYQFSGGSVDPVNVNAFPQNSAGDTAADKRRGRAVMNMCWQLRPDEALDHRVRPARWPVDADQHGAFLQQHGLSVSSGELHAQPHPSGRRRQDTPHLKSRRSRLSQLDGHSRVRARQCDLPDTLERIARGTAHTTGQARRTCVGIAKGLGQSLARAKSPAAARALRRHSPALSLVTSLVARNPGRIGH